MDKNLATIQIVSELNPIAGADKIEVASMKSLGWKCVVRKGEFGVGDLGCYIQIDTVVPDKPEFAFLKDRSFRVKTIRLKKTLSQGLLLPLKTCNITFTECVEGIDVSEKIGVKKYEKPIALNMRGVIRGDFPTSILPKTDEINIKSIPFAIDEMKSKEVYISVKCDGTSATFLNVDGDIQVCSRNLSLKETEDNIYWKMYHKYNMKKMFDTIGNYAIQAELIGPSIQKNPMQLSECELAVFNVYDIFNAKYLDFAEFQNFCQTYGLQTVPIEKVCVFDFTLDQLIEMAVGKYASGKQREGIVIRPLKETYSPAIDEQYGMRGRLSFKVLNDIYLEKEED